MDAQKFLAAIETPTRIVSRQLARRYRWVGLAADDLYQEGMLAAWTLAGDYDPAAALPWTYAERRVTGAMIDAIRRYPGFGRKLVRQIVLGEARLVVFGLDPDHPLTRSRLAVSDPEPADTPEEEFRAVLKEMRAEFCPGEPDVFVRLYVRGEDMKTAARFCGITESRVSQIHGRVIESIRAAAKQRGWTIEEGRHAGGQVADEDAFAGAGDPGRPEADRGAGGDADGQTPGPAEAPPGG